MVTAKERWGGEPCKADEDGPSAAIVVLGLVEEGRNVLADGGVVALCGHLEI